MKLSTKGRYGLLALGHLAKAYGERTVPISEMASLENLSISYLEQLFSSLKKAGIVKSERGSKGGYALKNPPEDTTLLDAIEALEGISLSCNQLEELPCLKRGSCASSCLTEKILDKVQREIDEVLKKYTLKDLA